MNYTIKIKNNLFKRKKVDIVKSNTPLDFSDETSNLKVCSLKSLKLAAKDHYSKILILGS
jgi:hypothetical protein